MKKWLFGVFLMLFAVMMYVPTAQAATTEDDFALKYFQDLYSNGNFKTDNADITVDTKTYEDGIMVNGKNAALSTEKIDMGQVDFETEELQRIQLSALGEKGKKTKVMIYLDGSEEATATFAVPAQSTADDWTKKKNVNVDVSDLSLSGSHTVQLTICQYNNNGTVKDSGSANVLLRKIQFVKQTIPVISINIDESLGTIDAMNSDGDHNTQCYGDMSISVPKNYTNQYDSSYTGGTYELEYIKGRGNSTWTQAKKPYKIKLDKKADLFGMGADKNWALLANALDSTLIHNRATYSMGEDLKMAYTPQGVSVDVIMNDQYLGNYYLCENVRVDEQRVNIDSDTEFLLGAGTWGADDGAYAFETDVMEFNVTSPESDVDNYEEKCDEIEHYMKKVECALMRVKDPDTGKVEDPFDFIDIDSAVSYYWLQELSENGDFLGTGSTYCYKKNDGKLYWGPLWDFDIAWDFEAEATEEEDTPGSGWVNQLYWYKLMLTFPEFTEKMEAYWNESMYPELQKVVADGGMLDQYKEELEYSAANDLTNADVMTATQNTEEAYEAEEQEEQEEQESEETVTCKTTAEGITQFGKNIDEFKSAIKARMKWCNENLDSMAVQNITVTFKSEGKTYATTLACGQEYFQSFPKNPTCSDKSKVFVGWYGTTKDDDGNTVTAKFSKDSDSILDFSQLKNGKRTVTLTAKFAKASSASSVTNVNFEKNSYRFLMDRSCDYCIPYATVPEEIGEGEIEWTNENDKIIAIKDDGNGLSIKTKRPGTSKITATLLSGKTFSVTVTVVDATSIDASQMEKYTIGEFALGSSKLNVAYGSAGKVSLKITDPKNYIDSGDGEFKWISTDEDVFTCTAGTVYGHKVGTAMLICKYSAIDEMQYCKVTVTPKKAYISKAKAGKKKIKVTMTTKPSSKGGSRYQVAYKKKGTSKWHYKTIKGKTVTIKKLKRKKKYYVKVRAYKKVDGKTYYGSYSKCKLVKVK